MGDPGNEVGPFLLMVQRRFQGLGPGNEVAHASRPDSRDPEEQWKSSLKTEIRALFYYYLFECKIKARYFGS